MLRARLYVHLQMALRITLLLVSISYVKTAPFQPVSSSCIYWDSLNVYSAVIGDTKQFHCIVDEKNQLGIVNVEWKWIGKDSCPYYDRYSKQINIKPCDAKLGLCPDKKFFSYQAIKYSACVETQFRDPTSYIVGNADEQGTTTAMPHLIQDANRHSNTLPAINVAVSLLILIILVVNQIAPYLKQKEKKRKESTPKDDVNQDEKLMNGNPQQETGDSLSF